MALIFIVIMVVFLLSFRAAVMAALKEERPPRANTCPPHKWVPMSQPMSDGSYLKCVTCGKMPSTNGEEV